MSFKTNGYLTIWEVTPVSDTLVKARVSSSRKNRQTNEYETDFSGFITFNGTSAANKARGLRERDRIKLGDVDVTTKYDKERNVTYTNFRVWSFEMANESGSASHSNEPSNPADEVNEPVDSDLLPDSDLPF